MPAGPMAFFPRRIIARRREASQRLCGDPSLNDATSTLGFAPAARPPVLVLVRVAHLARLELPHRGEILPVMNILPRHPLHERRRRLRRLLTPSTLGPTVAIPGRLSTDAILTPDAARPRTSPPRVPRSPCDSPGRSDPNRPRVRLRGSTREETRLDDYGPRDSSLETRVAKPGEEEAGQMSATGRLD